jgi:pimeloyl-ACP methyl ester carboxylesterase
MRRVFLRAVRSQSSGAPGAGRSDRHDPHSAPAIAKSNGIELCYDTFGDPKATPLLLIMGLASQMIVWDDEFCAELAAHGYWVIRFDNRDIGLSTKLDRLGVPNVAAAMMARLLGKRVAAPYMLRDMAGDAIGLLDALAIDRTHVVGASMGGAIAQEMAIHYPQRLRTLTLIMSSSGAPGLPRPKLKAMAVLMAPAPNDKTTYLKQYRRTWRVLRGRGFPLDEARDRERAEATYARGLNPAGAARQLVAIIASGSRADALRHVAVPTLVIHGAADPLLPVACGIDLAERIPGAKRLIIEGMGHALPISSWHQIIEAIAQHAR